MLNASQNAIPAAIAVGTVEERHDVGDVVRARAVIRDIADPDWPLVDPSAVAAKVKAPGAEPVELTVQRESAGVYLADFTATTPGVWRFRFTAAGTFEGASPDGMFVVARSAFSVGA